MSVARSQLAQLVDVIALFVDREKQLPSLLTALRDTDAYARNKSFRDTVDGLMGVLAGDAMARLEKARARLVDGTVKLEIGNEAAKKGGDAVCVVPFSHELSTGLCFQWSRSGSGFGELTLAVRASDHLLHVDMEGMSDDFCLGVLRQALAEARRR